MDRELFESTFRKFWIIVAFVLVCLALMFLGIGILSANAQTLTATQSITIEASANGLDGLGMLVIDLGVGPKHNITYIHDRVWPADNRRYMQHDISVTHNLQKERTATLGWRVKIPVAEPPSSVWYAMVAWRWGTSWWHD